MRCLVMLKLLIIRARLGHFGPNAYVVDVIRTLDKERLDTI